jgi:hypothetical protein
MSDETKIEVLSTVRLRCCRQANRHSLDKSPRRLWDPVPIFSRQAKFFSHECIKDEMRMGCDG